MFYLLTCFMWTKLGLTRKKIKLNKMNKNNTLAIIDSSKLIVSKIAAPEYKVYNNADTDKLQILTENKGKSGIYQWTHIESNKSYIGSAVDLSKRFKCYYSITYLTRFSNSNINNALIKY